MASVRLHNGIGLAVAGAALLGASVLALPATAGATERASAHVRAEACALVKKDTQDSSKVSDGIEKAIESGNWASAKKTLLSSFGGEAKAVQEEAALLRGAPSDIQADGKSLVKVEDEMKQAISSASSATQFESKFASLGENPKFEKASKAMIAYFGTAHCVR